jgi:organic hydroperoxide reductase OsmC/OhrA
MDPLNVTEKVLAESGKVGLAAHTYRDRTGAAIEEARRVVAAYLLGDLTDGVAYKIAVVVNPVPDEGHRAVALVAVNHEACGYATALDKDEEAAVIAAATSALHDAWRR